MIINTSFNIRGEPIVCTPQDAYRCFLVTNMDVLVLEEQILYKEEQPKANQHDIDEYKARFNWINGNTSWGVFFFFQSRRSLVEINWNPTRKMLQDFGLIGLIACPILAGILYSFARSCR